MESIARPGAPPSTGRVIVEVHSRNLRRARPTLLTLLDVLRDELHLTEAEPQALHPREKGGDDTGASHGVQDESDEAPVDRSTDAGVHSAGPVRQAPRH